MPTISKDDVNDVGGLAPEGWHRARVTQCESKRSQKGDAMYALAFESPTGQFLAYDNAMLEGRGNGIGIAKLIALGACEDLGDSYEYDLPHHVLGKECWVYLVHAKYTTNGGEKRDKCEVDIKQGHCGYLPLDQPPQELASEPYDEPEPSVDPDDEIPF